MRRLQGLHRRKLCSGAGAREHIDALGERQPLADHPAQSISCPVATSLVIAQPQSLGFLIARRGQRMVAGDHLT